MSELLTSCCKIPCKGKNFKANHNKSNAEKHRMEVVKYPAKVRILKQITTLGRTREACYLL